MATASKAQSDTPYRQIRALYDDITITVYQAYNRNIANAAVSQQKLHASPQFRPSRMTWIKPSWAWMLYRAGYSYKDPGQERILALKMKHEDFIALLEKAVLTFGHGRNSSTGTVAPTGEAATEPATAVSPNEEEIDSLEESSELTKRERRQRNLAAGKSPDVKVQWDPERTVRLEKLEYRSIQIGIPAAVSPEWTEKWIVSIEDVTERARELKRVLDERPNVSDRELVDLGLVPAERPFDVPEHLQKLLAMAYE